MPRGIHTYKNQHQKAKEVLVHNLLSFYPSSVTRLLWGLWWKSTNSSSHVHGGHKAKGRTAKGSPLMSLPPQGSASQLHKKIQQKGFSTGALTDVYILNHWGCCKSCHQMSERLLWGGNLMYWTLVFQGKKWCAGFRNPSGSDTHCPPLRVSKWIISLNPKGA